MSITLQSEYQVYILCVSIKVFHRLWFDNPKKGKAAVGAQGGFAAKPIDRPEIVHAKMVVPPKSEKLI
jgi:hypothetical protein